MKKMLDDMRHDAIARLKEAEEGRELLLQAAERVITLAGIMKRKGTGGLEKETENVELDYLKRLIRMTVKGTAPELMVEIATNEYWVKSPEGVQAMIEYMYLRGMVGIQKGESERILTEVLMSLMPALQRQKYQERIDKKKAEAEELHRKEIEAKFPCIRPSFYDTRIPKKIQTLEKEIHKLPNPCVKRLMRDIDSEDLAVCVYAFSENTRRKILNNLGERFAEEIMEKVVCLSAVSEKEMSNRAAEMLSIIDILEKRREIYEQPEE